MGIITAQICISSVNLNKSTVPADLVTFTKNILKDSATDIRFFGIWCVSLAEVTVKKFRLLFLIETDL